MGMDAAAVVVPPHGLEYGYVPIVLYQGLNKPSDCHSPGPMPAPRPTPAPSPMPPPSPPSPSPGLTLFEKAGSGKLELAEANFKANHRSGRGGAPAWDACAGATFDNGHFAWVKGNGSHIDGFMISGDWKVVTAGICGASFNYDNMPVSREYSSADGIVSVPGHLNYFEIQPA